MKKVLRVGIVIADDSEYAPIRERAEVLSAERADFFSREGHAFAFRKEDRTIALHTLLCGVGMVNAAGAATALALEKNDVILNAGLSGGISGIARNEIMLGTEYIEHDFDLTSLGYRPCEKPLQNYIYKADSLLTDIFSSLYPGIKKGVAVSGDCFVSSTEKRDFLKEQFGAMSCDMESAAVAYVCELAGIRFLSLRRISDDAGEDATVNYREMNGLKESVLIDLLLSGVKNFFDFDALWQ